jgi:hypothetical protein
MFLNPYQTPKLKPLNFEKTKIREEVAAGSEFRMELA